MCPCLDFQTQKETRVRNEATRRSRGQWKEAQEEKGEEKKMLLNVAANMKYIKSDAVETEVSSFLFHTFYSCCLKYWQRNFMNENPMCNNVILDILMK